MNIKNSLAVVALIATTIVFGPATFAGEDVVSITITRADGTVERTEIDLSKSNPSRCGHKRSCTCGSIHVTHTSPPAMVTHIWHNPAPPLAPVVQPIYVEKQPVYYEAPQTVYWSTPSFYAGASFSAGSYGGSYRPYSYYQVNNSWNEMNNYRNTQHLYGYGSGGDKSGYHSIFRGGSHSHHGSGHRGGGRRH